MASLGHGDEAIAVFKEVHGSAKGAITFDEFCAVWKSNFGRPTPSTQPNSLADFHTGPVEVEHGSLAVCCCPQTIVPGETRLRLRAVWTLTVGTTSRRWRGAPES